MEDGHVEKKDFIIFNIHGSCCLYEQFAGLCGRAEPARRLKSWPSSSSTKLVAWSRPGPGPAAAVSMLGALTWDMVLTPRSLGGAGDQRPTLQTDNGRYNPLPSV